MSWELAKRSMPLCRFEIEPLAASKFGIEGDEDLFLSKRLTNFRELWIMLENMNDPGVRSWS